MPLRAVRRHREEGDSGRYNYLKPLFHCLVEAGWVGEQGAKGTEQVPGPKKAVCGGKSGASSWDRSWRTHEEVVSMRYPRAAS